MKSVNRRIFIRTGAAGIAGLALAQNTKADYSNSENTKSNLIKRKLGITGIELPIVSMGVGSADSPAVVKGALKMGLCHFDTAYRYQSGNSEKMLGEVLKDYPRESFVIATKIKTCESKEEFINLLDESLSRLQMEFVDILYLHAVGNREEALNSEMLEALKMAKSSGKAKHLGLSTHKNEPEVIQAAIDSNVYEVILSAINFKQNHAAELKEKIALAADKGIGIIGMKVMAGGFLDKEKQFPVNYKAALKWVLQDENVTTTIPSIINLEQLIDNASVLQDYRLNDKEKTDLETSQLEAGLYCNGCSKCIKECKKQLPIPELMRAFMYSYGYKESAKAKELLVSLNLENNPCSNCNVCTAICTKGFNISDKITDVNRLISIPSEFLS